MAQFAAATREPDVCPDKQALVEQVKKIISDILSVHNKELESVLRGDFTNGESAEVRLKELRALKSVMIERFRCHVAEHGC